MYFNIAVALFAAIFLASCERQNVPGHVDPAPIPQDVSESIVKGVTSATPHALPEALKRHLEETAALLGQLKQSTTSLNGATLQPAVLEKLSFIASRRYELTTLRADIKATFGDASALNLTLQAEQLRYVENRFDRLDKLLAAVEKSNDRGGVVAGHCQRRCGADGNF